MVSALQVFEMDLKRKMYSREYGIMVLSCIVGNLAAGTLCALFMGWQALITPVALMGCLYLILKRSVDQHRKYFSTLP